MRIYRIDERRLTHTCPADPNPHPVDIRRTVVHITTPQPCLTPVTVHNASESTVVACWRREPHERQCDNCRVVITTGTITVEHLGHDEPGHTTPVPSGTATDPCTVCHKPLAAVLAAYGRHIGCYPHRRIAA